MIPQMPTVADLIAQLDSMNRRLARIDDVIDLLLVKRVTRKEQARMAGVCTKTLRRREQRERLRRMVNGHAISTKV
jgi:hypothetical protein